MIFNMMKEAETETETETNVSRTYRIFDLIIFR
jgi:hypothetical protein